MSKLAERKGIETSPLYSLALLLCPVEEQWLESPPLVAACGKSHLCGSEGSEKEADPSVISGVLRRNPTMPSEGWAEASSSALLHTVFVAGV